HPRTDHGDGILVLGQKFTLNIEDNRRIVDLPKQFGIFGIRLRDDPAAELRDAFQFRGEIHVLFPIRDGYGGFVANASRVQELLLKSSEYRGRIAEMFE